MPTITLKAEGRKNKVAMVRVRNTDGTLNRAFRITEAQYAAIAATGAPPGVTKEEWESNLAYAVGQELDAGDCKIDAQGALWIKLGEQVTVNDVQEAGIVINAGLFTGTPPNVSISPAVLATLEFNIDRHGNQKPVRVAVTDVTNGVVTWARL